MMMMAPHALLAAPLTTIPSSSSSFSSSSSISSVSSLQNALFPLSFSPLRLQKRCSAPSPTRMSLKIVHTYDSSFELKPEVSLSLPTYKFYVIIHFFTDHNISFIWPFLSFGFNALHCMPFRSFAFYLITLHCI